MTAAPAGANGIGGFRAHFQCGVLKADGDAESHIRKFQPSLAGRNAVVNVGAMAIHFLPRAATRWSEAGAPDAGDASSSGGGDTWAADRCGGAELGTVPQSLPPALLRAPPSGTCTGAESGGSGTFHAGARSSPSLQSSAGNAGPAQHPEGSPAGATGATAAPPGSTGRSEEEQAVPCGMPTAAPFGMPTAARQLDHATSAWVCSAAAKRRALLPAAAIGGLHQQGGAANPSSPPNIWEEEMGGARTTRTEAPHGSPEGGGSEGVPNLQELLGVQAPRGGHMSLDGRGPLEAQFAAILQEELSARLPP